MPLFSSNLITTPVEEHPGYQSGKYYLHTPFCPAATNTTTALIANSLTFTPLFIPKSVRIDRLGIRTIVDVAGSLTRIGIYNNSSGLPNNLLLDGGEINTSTTNFKEQIIDLTLTPGWYWLAGNCSVAPNLQTPTAYFGSLYYLGLPPLASSNNYAYYTPNITYGALPSVAPVSGITSKSNFPLFWFRAA